MRDLKSPHCALVARCHRTCVMTSMDRLRAACSRQLTIVCVVVQLEFNLISFFHLKWNPIGNQNICKRTRKVSRFQFQFSTLKTKV